MEPKPLAFSYSRFSSPQQAKGDSIRRQVDARNAFIERNGLVLDDKLHFSDHGVSSFRSRNLSDKFALGQFLNEVRNGRVPHGSYLLLESLDRLSRDDVDEAMQLLLTLTKAGIVVVQLLPVEMIYQKPVDPIKLILGIVELSRGNSESRMKSERVGAAWEQKRKRARESKAPVTHHCPSWIRRAGDRYELIPENAATVRRMFALAADGYGFKRMVSRLIEEGLPVLGTSGRWNLTHCQRTLRNRAVLGEYQPTLKRKPTGDPIPGYYPPVVSEELFYRVQASLAERKSYRGGHSQNGINLFQKLLFNAEDGDRFDFKWDKNRPHSKEKPLGRYTNAKSCIDGTPAVSFQAVPFERELLRSLAELSAEEVEPLGAAVSESTVAIEAQHSEVSGQLQRLEDQLVEGGNSAVLTKAIRRLEARLCELDEKLEVAKADQAVRGESTLQGTKTLIDLLDDPKDPEGTRIRLRNCLRRLIAKIVVLVAREGLRQCILAQIHFKQSRAIRSVLIRYRTQMRNNRHYYPAHLSSLTVKKELPVAGDCSIPKYRQLIKVALQRAVSIENWRKTVEPDLPLPQPLKRAAKRDRGSKP